MSTLILDIETVGEEWELLDGTTQRVLTRWIERSNGSPEQRAAQLRDLKEGLGFSPLTGCIVAMGMYDVERAQGVVFYDTNGTASADIDTGEYVLKSRTEAAMLRDFWEGARLYDTFVTFNGRAFDIPFIILRSLVHGITPTRNLMSNRYLGSQRDARHVDLQDQLSFYGAVLRKQPLHLYCRAFGIPSPKADGVSGDDVAKLFADKQYETIARYNSRDITATTQLYEVYRTHLGLLDGAGDGIDTLR
jgi:3'-5' exonuclease